MMMKFLVVMVLLLASPMPSVALTTFTSATVNLTTAKISLIASDGLSTGVDSVLYPSSLGGGAQATALVTETGTQGVINPTRVFDGSITISPTSLEWTGINPTGTFSNLASSVTFSVLTMTIEDSPVALLRTNGALIQGQQIASRVHGAGTFTFGQQVIPFDFTYGFMSSMTSWDETITYASWTGPGHHVFAAEVNGITYDGYFQMAGNTAIPEPTTGLLLGLGLAGLSSRDLRPLRRTRSTDRPPWAKRPACSG